MSLISCPDCGKEVSSTAKFCLGCGRRFRNRTLNVVGLVVSLLIMISGFFFINNTSEATSYFSLFIWVGFILAIVFATRI